MEKANSVPQYANKWLLRCNTLTSVSKIDRQCFATRSWPEVGEILHLTTDSSKVFL